MKDEIKIPSSTLAELRNVLVRALSKENLSETDKHQLYRNRSHIRKSQSSSSLRIHYTVSSNYGGKKIDSLLFLKKISNKIKLKGSLGNTCLDGVHE